MIAVGIKLLLNGFHFTEDPSSRMRPVLRMKLKNQGQIVCGCGLTVIPPTCTELTIAHVLPFHYPDESGKWLADEERIAPRLPLKKYPTKKDW